MSIRNWQRGQIRLLWIIGLAIALIVGRVWNVASLGFFDVPRWTSGAVALTVLVAVVILSAITWKWMNYQRPPK